MTAMSQASAALLTAEEVLERVFADLPAGSRRKREDIPVHVVSQWEEPRWIILGSSRSALPVLRSWAPWKLSSRVRWNVVRASAALNVLPSLPKVQNSNVSVETSYWRSMLSTFPKKWSAVIHVGNRSHTRKAILFVIEKGERVVCAGKVPLLSGSSSAVLNEGMILDLLKHLENLPRVLFRDPARGVVAQSWLAGEPVSRRFTRAHLELLSSLEQPECTVRLSDSLAELAAGINAADFPFDRTTLLRGLELVDFSVPLRGFVEHRDFAPWNMKWIRPGVLGLLDWEWAVPHGLPWQDICRYFFLDDVHFHGPGEVWTKINADRLLLEYRRKFEIPPAAIAPLTMRYLLGEFLMEWAAGNAWLAEYAYRQIELLLRAVSPARA